MSKKVILSEIARKPDTRYTSLNPGDIFLFDGVLYIRGAAMNTCSFGLLTHDARSFSTDTMVHRVSIEEILYRTL